MDFVGRLLYGLGVICLTWIAYTIVAAVKVIYFHPLSHVPGSQLWIAFPFLKFLAAVTGRRDEKIRSYHARFGDAVRISPDEISFATVEAWEDIYGHRLNYQMPKSAREPGRPQDLLSASAEVHARLRKLVSGAFSPRALQGQEKVIQLYVSMLVGALRKYADENKVFNLVDLMNFTTFDIIGDLSFGQSFDGLRKLETHGWVQNLFDMLATVPLFREGSGYPALMFVLRKLPMAKGMIDARKYTWNFTAECVNRRLQDGTRASRSDLVEAMNKGKGSDEAMSELEMIAVSLNFLMAGSETTATLMSGLCYWLLRTPGTLHRLNKELRSTFEMESDITIASTGDPRRVPYLHACIEEALRMYVSVLIILLLCVRPAHQAQRAQLHKPFHIKNADTMAQPPVPGSLERLTTLPTTIISNIPIPAGFKVGLHHSAAYWSPRNFTRPREFLPERFLKEAKEDPRNEFHNDKRNVLQPFSYGPRNCVGKILAYAELRVITARMLWNFDMEFAETMDVTGWERQKSFIVWQKKPIWVRMRVRDGA